MNARLAALAAAALALLCALQVLALLRMPQAHLPERIGVALVPGASIELDGAALAAPQAPARALRLRRDEAGRWWAASPRAASALRFHPSEGNGAPARSGTIGLAPGMRFQLGARHVTVSAAGPRALQLADGVHAWGYDGATVWRDGAALAACPRAGLGTRLAGLWNRWTPAPLGIARPLVFGGSLDCGTRIGNPHAAVASATVSFVDGVPVLSAGTGPARVPLLVGLDGALQDLALAESPLAGVGAIGIGGTRLRIVAQGDSLQLAPAGRVALYGEARKTLPAGVAWHWTGRAVWAWPAAALPWFLLALAAGALAGYAAWRAPYRKQPALALRLGGGILLALLGLGLLLAGRAGQPPGAAQSLTAACAALAYGMGEAAAARTRGGVSAAAVLLLAAGLLVQLELGTGAPDTSWLRHFQKTAAVATLGLGLLGCWTLRPRRGRAGQAQVEMALLALAGAAVAALLVQVGWGDETGVFDLQPVEFAKLALTVLSAHCIALGLDARNGQAARAGRSSGRAALLRWLRLVSPALLFIALLGVALVQVDDYSPLILLLVWSAATLLAWSYAARRRGAALAVAGLACLCVGALVLLRGTGVEDPAQWRFYGERFGVWLAPATHPHTGAQLLLGAQAIAAGGWLGADGALGLLTLGQGAAAGLAIPAVQDDFAPSFLLLRHGLAGGLLLWALQALFLCALLRAALGAWGGAARARNYIGAWQGRFRCFVLCGGAAFVFGHFLLSWGTNLAFFPVMGQPMSFLSAGGSHLLFFIFPLLAVAAAGDQAAGEPLIEEN